MYNPKLGHINFLNVLPFTYGYENGAAEGVTVVNGVPVEVNTQIKNKLLDVSLMSSIEYARQSDNLILLPKFCVRADGDVTSIILVSRKPIEDLDGEHVVITAKSATAHCLLKIILRESYHVKPNYDVGKLDVAELIPADATAALFIGDDALYVHLHEREGFHYYDMGREWKKLTGLQMVYAVFAARKEFAEHSPKRLEFVCDKISDSYNYGIANKKAAVNSVLNIKPFTFDELDYYLGGVIKWDLTSEGLTALETFYKLSGQAHIPRLQ